MQLVSSGLVSIFLVAEVVMRADASSAHGNVDKSTVSSSNDQVATEEQATEEDIKASSDNVPLYLSIVALIAGLLALGISKRLNNSFR